jgi:hypothetical protein
VSARVHAPAPPRPEPRDRPARVGPLADRHPLRAGLRPVRRGYVPQAARDTLRVAPQVHHRYGAALLGCVAVFIRAE